MLNRFACCASGDWKEMSDAIHSVELDDIRFGGKHRMWWPNYDTDPQRTFTHIMKRVTDVDLTAGFCKKGQRRTVVQAGGHVGLFPLRLAKHFERVISFEPDPALYEALKRNVEGRKNVDCLPLALGDHAGTEKLALKFRPGSASIVVRDDATGTVDVDMITIDSLALQQVDAMVIDVEHYEVEVLKGARETIKRCSPVIHVEELPRRRDELQALIKGLGYIERRRVHGDAIYTRG